MGRKVGGLHGAYFGLGLEGWNNRLILLGWQQGGVECFNLWGERIGFAVVI